MSIFHAVILGIIEGITEFLPISSTGHLILASKLLGISQTDFVKTFEITIQLGAILAVIVLYWKKIYRERRILEKMLLAFLPTGILGFIFYQIVKRYLIGNEWLVVVSLALVGAIFIIVEIFLKEEKLEIKKIGDMSRRKSFLVGVIQSFSMIPGVSRSGATILGGLFLGINRETIVEFSFLLAIPTMMAATGYDLLKNYHAFSGADFSVLAIGFVVSFIVAIPFIKILISFIKKNALLWFGVYRIIIAVIFAVILLR